jgi:2-polyprenyl-3-methyl-5-hydroxy-6-metoxy-1,4-benzoquinol methylase
VICGPGAPIVPWRSVGDWPLVRCGRCGLVSLSGAAAAGATVSDTNEPFFSSKDFNEWFLERESVFRERYRRDLARIAELSPPPGRLLDVGCGPGLFLDEARGRGWEVEGVEASPVPASIARERFGLAVHTGVLEEAPLAEESFDVITFFDVLEHLPAPRAVLGRARRLLKRGGLLVAQSPNLASLMANLTAERWRWYFLPQHLHHFTPATLGRLLRSERLEPVRTTTWDVPEEFVANLQDRFAWLGGRAWLRRGLRVGLAFGSRAWGAAGWGGLVQVFARKHAIRAGAA